MKDAHKELKRKRTKYVIGLITQFQLSGDEQTSYNCFENVIIEHEYGGLSGFQDSLPEDERKILSQKQHVWFMCFESFNTFSIFLKNQGLSFENE